jgi:hypothetical protein
MVLIPCKREKIKMGRPLKTGLDYFPLDCNFDNKVRALIGKYRARGFGIFVHLLQCIYNQGYFLAITEEVIEDISIEMGEEEEFINDIIKFCCKRGIFSPDCFKEKILTSHGIQKRFSEATKRRKEFNNVSRYLVNVDNNLVNVGNNPDNESGSTQSKVKKSKVKKSKYLENVFLTPEEYEALVYPWGVDKKVYTYLERERAIEKLDNYLETSGKKYKSHFAVLKGWVYDGIKGTQGTPGNEKTTKVDMLAAQWDKNQAAG